LKTTPIEVAVASTMGLPASGSLDPTRNRNGVVFILFLCTTNPEKLVFLRRKSTAKAAKNIQRAGYGGERLLREINSGTETRSDEFLELMAES